MNIITSFLEHRAAKKRERLEAEKQALGQRMDQLRADIAKAEARMTSRPCAIAGRDCYRECIHFKPGSANSFVAYHGETICFTDNPRCKLWGEE